MTENFKNTALFNNNVKTKQCSKYEYVKTEQK